MELGIKSELFDNTLRLNASIYSTEITDLQVARFDPSNVAFLVFLENVGDAETRGLDVDFMWAVTGRLTLSGAASILDTELTKINKQLQGVAVPKGSELPSGAQLLRQYPRALRLRHHEWQCLGKRCTGLPR